MRHLYSCAPYSADRLWRKQRSYNKCVFLRKYLYDHGWLYQHPYNPYNTFTIDATGSDSNTDKAESDDDQGSANANGDSENTDSHADAINANTDSYP